MKRQAESSTPFKLFFSSLFSTKWIELNSSDLNPSMLGPLAICHNLLSFCIILFNLHAILLNWLIYTHWKEKCKRLSVKRGSLSFNLSIANIFRLLFKYVFSVLLSSWPWPPGLKLAAQTASIPWNKELVPWLGNCWRFSIVLPKLLGQWWILTSFDLHSIHFLLRPHSPHEPQILEQLQITYLDQ